MRSSNDSVAKAKQTIVKILIKINSHFDYPMDDKKLELIAEDWINALFGFSDEVIKHSYSQIIQQSKKRPTLADFVAQCNASKRAITSNNYANSSFNQAGYECWDNFRASVSRKYGEAYAQRHCDPAKAEYDIAKAESKFEEYKDKKLKQLTEFLRGKKMKIDY